MPSARVAIVGAGPSGVYAAEEAHKHGYLVDVFDRLPTPYGLLRYGVAPDHLKMKSLEKTMEHVFELPGVSFVGGVELGRDVTVEELRAGYDAVIYAFGASSDRHLGIPGDERVVAATEFVKWYSGHPDAQPFRLDATSVAVIGMGNVAVDVARILVKRDLDHTDIPQHVLDELSRSAVTDVHIVGRRGPEFAKFTTKELRELGELEGVSVDVAPIGDLSSEDHTVERNLAVFRDWAARTWEPAPRTVHWHFNSPPEAVSASGLLAGGSLIPAQMVIRSIGYLGVPVEGLPFENGTIPHVEGRVLRDGVVSPGEYVVGWIKRGPTGVIGTNKHDAHETVASLVEDLGEAGVSEKAGVDVKAVDWQGWLRIDAAERALGATRERTRTKLHDWEGLRGAAE